MTKTRSKHQLKINDKFSKRTIDTITLENLLDLPMKKYEVKLINIK